MLLLEVLSMKWNRGEENECKENYYNFKFFY